jgi:hypothetical protein
MREELRRDTSTNIKYYHTVVVGSRDSKKAHYPLPDSCTTTTVKLTEIIQPSSP